jgi:hypothetical protein
MSSLVCRGLRGGEELASRLRKNSGLDFALKGRGFSRADRAQNESRLQPPEFAFAMKLFFRSLSNTIPPQACCQVYFRGRSNVHESIHRRASLSPVHSPHSHFGDQNGPIFCAVSSVPQGTLSPKCKPSEASFHFRSPQHFITQGMIEAPAGQSHHTQQRKN